MIVSPTNLLWQHRFRGLLGVSQHHVANDGCALLIKPDDFETRTYQLLSVDRTGHAAEAGAVGVETLHKFPGVAGGALLIGMTDDDIYVFREGRKVRFLADRRVTYTDVSLAPQRGWFVCSFSDALFSTHGIAFGDANARLAWTKDLNAPPNRVAITGDGHALAVGLQNGKVLALDNMRAPKWECVLEQPVTALALGESHVTPVVGTESGMVVALDEDGGIRWRSPVGLPVVELAVDAQARWTAALCSDGGNHLLVCLGPDGGVLWEYDLDSRPTGVSLSPDGKLLLLTTASGTAALFEIDFSATALAGPGLPRAAEEGRLAREEGDLPRAHAGLSEAVQASPHDLALAEEFAEVEQALVAEYRDAARRALEDGNSQVAFEALNAAAALAPWDAALFEERCHCRQRVLETLAERAATQRAVQDWPGAQATWLEALTLDPHSSTAREALHELRRQQSEELMRQGDECREHGDLSVAVTLWQQAQRIDPSEELGHRLKEAEVERCLAAGIAMYESQRMAEAIFQLKKVLAVDPDNEQAARYLGYAQGMTQDNLIADRFARLE